VNSTPRPLVAVVEDEPAIADAVAARLKADGFEVVTAGDGPGGLALCLERRPQVVVLDLMLPGLDGWEVCRRLQAALDVRVLMLTARADEADVVAGLRSGADDYVTKPFSVRELSARVAALLRRGPAVAVEGPTGLSLDRSARRARRDGVEVHLTPTEFDLLARLSDRPGAVLGREQLLADVWGWRGGGSTTRTVDTHVAALRRKLGDDVVRTVHGVGYALGDA
jgi:DNA-binding response OmpR family regulator